jgi:hypothetical protein
MEGEMTPYLPKPLLVLLSGWLLLAGIAPGSAAAQEGLFGARVAGSFLAQLELTGPSGDEFPVQALATLSADGGAVATDTDDFGFGTGTFFHSPKQGAWKRTGRRAVSITLLEFAYDSQGALTTIYKLVFDGRFSDRNLNTGEGTVTLDAFLPTQDPLDPDEDPIATGSGTFSVQRIKA